MPAVYPVLLYLLVRLLMAGFRPREREGPLIPFARESWLLAGLALLLIGRIVLNVVDSDVIDVGYTSVIGADNLLHGKDLTGYGPVMFLAYVPFELIFPSHGTWDGLPAAHAAALTFDLLTVVGLLLLGRAAARGARGPHARDRARLRLGGLPVLDLRAPVEHQRRARGHAARLLAAGAAHPGSERRAARPRDGGQVLPCGAGAAVRRRHGRQARPAARCVSRARSRPSAWWPLYVALPDGGLRELWDDTLGYQVSRESPFSLWGLHPSLGWLQSHARGGHRRPSASRLRSSRARRDARQVAALAAAAVIALQLCANYWLFFYVSLVRAAGAGGDARRLPAAARRARTRHRAWADSRPADRSAAKAFPQVPI